MSIYNTHRVPELVSNEFFTLATIWAANTLSKLREKRNVLKQQIKLCSHSIIRQNGTVDKLNNIRINLYNINEINGKLDNAKCYSITVTIPVFILSNSACDTKSLRTTPPICICRTIFEAIVGSHSSLKEERWLKQGKR